MEIFQNIWHNQKKNQGDHSEEILPKYKENGLTKTEIVEGMVLELATIQQADNLSVSVNQKEVEETKETINFKKLTTGKLTLPEGITNLKMQIEITITGGKGEVSLDDFKLYPNENNSIDNIIENGHLESIKNQLPIGYKFENISTDRTVDGIVLNDCRDEHLPVLGNYVMHFSFFFHVQIKSSFFEYHSLEME